MVVRARSLSRLLDAGGPDAPTCAGGRSRWKELLQIEADVIWTQPPGPGSMSGLPGVIFNIARGTASSGASGSWVACMFFHMHAGSRLPVARIRNRPPRRAEVSSFRARMKSRQFEHIPRDTGNAQSPRMAGTARSFAKKFRGINDSITAHIGDQTPRFLLHPECEFLSDTIGANTLPQA